MLNIVESIDHTIADILAELPKVKTKSYGWKAAAARMRKHSLTLEKQMKEFRKLSVVEANKE